MATRTQKTRIEINATDKSSKAFKSATAAAGKLSKAIGAVGIAAGAAAVGGLAVLGAKSLESIDSLAKMADRAGSSTEALQAMHLAGQLAGASTETVDKLVTKMNQSIGKAAQGTGAAAAAFDQLGLDMSEIIALPADQKFGVIADRLNDVDDTATKTALAMDIFGRGGADAMNLIAGGAEGVAAAADEVDRLGISVSRVDAAKVEMANDAMAKLGRAFEGIGNRIAVAAAPLLKLFADLLTDSVANADWLKLAIDGLSDFVVQSVGFMADAWYALNVVWTGLKVGFLTMADFIVGGIADLDRSLTELVNKIPGMEWEPSPGLQEWATTFETALAETNAELTRMFEQPWPSEHITAAFQAAIDEVERTAQVVAESNTRSLEVSAATVAALEEQENEADARAEERRQKREQAEETHAEKVLRIWESGARGKMDLIGGFFSDLSVLQETNSKKLFEVGKVAAIAETVINTHRAAVSAYASLAPIPIIGPALGAAAAAAAIAYGFAQVQNIKSQSFGGGSSSGGTTAPGTPTTTATPPAEVATDIPEAPGEGARQGPQVVNLTLQNDTVFSDDYLRNTFIPELNKVIGDGVIIKTG